MSRITKQIATSVANQLILPKKQELRKEEEKLSVIVTEVYLKHIPEEVMSLFEKLPNYFRSRSSIKLNEHGFNFEYFSLTKNLPEKTNDSYVQISSKEADLIKAQDSVVRNMKTEIEKLHFDIETALINYRTYNNIEKEFPEAFKLLPQKQTTALIVNIKDIRCKLDKANC